MTDESHGRASRIFLKASELREAERSDYLDRACDGDLKLRRDVESLLAHDSTMTTESVPSRDGSTLDRIGPYRILKKIGEGGMGVVYLAEQQEPVKRRVALKLIKAGMDTKAVVARFEAERQALALMDHPNVARVYDAGATTHGRPFFVMEHVPGVPITEHCDKQRLSIEERLNLFSQVCEAVQHAHQKGIIHRDIKPSNILVSAKDSAGVPKVIDFGVAKAVNQPVTENTILTEHGQLIGTPEYMSPEQAEMTAQDIDTRSDIYSLGVLLYELLTGDRPFSSRMLRRAAPAEIQRIIREEDPPKPSTRLRNQGDQQSAKRRRADVTALVRRLRGDLDWIVMKCLEKDRARRYETASGLAADLHRHLEDQPVEAGPPSTSYRISKFVRRNRVGVAAAAVVLLVLLAGIIGTTAGLLRAIEAQRAEAEQRRVAEAATLFMDEMLADADPAEHGSRLEVRELLDSASARLGSSRFGDEGRIEATIRSRLGQMYIRLGLFGQAESHFRHALRIRHSLFGNNHAEVARSKSQLARALYRQGQNGEAESLFREAIQDYQELPTDVRADLATALNQFGELLWMNDQLDRAEELVREGLLLRRDRFGHGHITEVYSLRNLAWVLGSRGDHAEAELVLNRALSIARPELGDDHTVVHALLLAMSDCLREQDRLAESESLARQVLATGRERFGDAHPTVATALWQLAMAMWQQGQLKEAETLLQELLSINRTLYTEGSQGHWYIPKTKVELGMVLAADGRYEAAESQMLDGFRGLEASLEAPRWNAQQAAAQIVELYISWGMPDKAAEWRARLDELKAEGEAVDE